MKKLSFLLLAAALLASAFLVFPSCAKKQDAPPFSVLARADCPASEIKLWRSPENRECYLFLPSDADRAALTVQCPEGDVTIGDETVCDGDATGILAEADRFTLRIGSKEYALNVFQSAALPSVFIQTESGSLDKIHADKQYKEPASFTLLADGALQLDRAPLTHIKGRGHSTWRDAEKKPYNVKFAEKTGLLGMGAAKNWALLADTAALSRYKEPLAMELAAGSSLAYTPGSRHVDLYINGEYRGLYRVSEKVEVGKQRLNIFDLNEANEKANPDKPLSEYPEIRSAADGSADSAEYLNPNDRRWFALPNGPAEYAKGYLLELSDEPDEESAFCTDRGQLVSLATPKYATQKQADYIADLYQRAEDALFSEDGYNADGEYYADFFDPESFADAYILREFMMDYDAGVSSTFFFKPTEADVFYAGPLWDFEGSMPAGLVSFGVDFSEPGWWWANGCPHISAVFEKKGAAYYPKSLWGMPSFFAAMYRHEDFRAVVQSRWNALSGRITEGLRQLSETKQRLAGSELMDALRWVGDGTRDASQLSRTQNELFSSLVSFLVQRKSFLDIGFSENAAMLYYDANGGEGVMFHNEILCVGDAAHLKPPNGREQQELLNAIFLDGSVSFSELDGLLSPPSSEYEFAGWNTAPDGSGETYQPGDDFTVTRKTNVLYAQWKKK